MEPIEFTDLPPKKTKARPPSQKWLNIVAQCQARPGEWALISRDAPPSNSATAKKHGLQTATRRSENPTRPLNVDIYVRWPAEEA